VASANQTAPSGAIASRPRRTIGVSSTNRAISPAPLTRAMARAGRSVYQALPSAATASPSGSMLRLDVGSRSTRPSRRRPIASAWSMVNQMVPLGPAAIAIGASCGSLMRGSTNFSWKMARPAPNPPPPPTALATPHSPPATTGMPSTAALHSRRRMVSARRMGGAAPARQVQRRKTADDQHQHAEREPADEADRVDTRQQVFAFDGHAPDFRIGHQRE